MAKGKDDKTYSINSFFHFIFYNAFWHHILHRQQTQCALATAVHCRTLLEWSVNCECTEKEHRRDQRTKKNLEQKRINLENLLLLQLLLHLTHRAFTYITA